MRMLVSFAALASCFITAAGCGTQTVASPTPSAAAQLPSSPQARDALITCGAGMRSGATAEIVAAYDKAATNGKITADAWRAIEAAFLKYVPPGDQQKALASYQDCVVKLAGKEVEPGAIPAPTPAPKT